MPGPVSDSYDPEFSTGANAGDVREAIQDGIRRLTEVLGPQLKDIVEVAQYSGPEATHTFELTEREARALRFASLRALDSI